ncbi:unnamed protein product [Arctogadus glacialis]
MFVGFGATTPGSVEAPAVVQRESGAFDSVSTFLIRLIQSSLYFIHGNARKTRIAMDTTPELTERGPSSQLLFLPQGLLHLWVMIVLLTYTPEMHTDHPGGR